ncbi:hypothetical protein AAHA92_32903 [Salvia divinorum]|uniref:Uncharacterized protein n=1 Tax=Salvia divinorum TaxID=28513 RepID=A0ABD1FMP7_SALDI
MINPPWVVNDCGLAIKRDSGLNSQSLNCLTDYEFSRPDTTLADCVWAEIFKKNHFGGAYYHRDEPEFYRLATIFGLAGVKKKTRTQ